MPAPGHLGGPASAPADRASGARTMDGVRPRVALRGGLVAVERAGSKGAGLWVHVAGLPRKIDRIHN